MDNVARWKKFLSSKRLGLESRDEGSRGRTNYQRDFDRVAFSSAFRRLQDKTQVFPLAESDYVRTRLTHSIEVSCVGRSLGTIVGEKVIKKYGLEKDYEASDLGAIVAAACLSHDIGNPPFGHSGEEAIKHWFAHSNIGQDALEGLHDHQKEDFLNFEGNAQGFRVLTRLQNPDNEGGLQLTSAVLASFTKYPRESYVKKGLNGYEGISIKKHGFFQAEKDFFTEVATDTGLEKRVNNAVWHRHPLAFLVEAADDICYQIMDFEDGFRLGYVGYDAARSLLLDLIDDSAVEKRLERIQGNKERIEYLRAKAINTLIRAASDCFMKNEEAIVGGTFDEELISKTKYSNKMNEIKSKSIEDVYSVQPVLEIEAAGFEVIGGMLDLFVQAVTELSKKDNKASAKSKKLLQLIPQQFLGVYRKPDSDLYTRLIKITDFVSGMTDTYAVSTFKKIRGISLPHA